MNPPRCYLVFFLLLLALPSPVRAGSESLGIFCELPPPSPWAIEGQTALLFGINNPNHYRLAPQMLSLWWQPVSLRWQGVGLGFTAMATPVIQGPESFLSGGALAFRYTWKSPGWPVEPYFTARLGCGAIDSRPVPEAQGQDFVFLIQGEGGLRTKLTPHLSLQGGVLYQHMSNAGLSEPARPNVGLDAIGPFLSLRWEF